MAAPSPSTILFFDHTAQLSGAEISLFHIVTHLDLTRWEPVVVLAEEGPLREQLSARGIETHVLPLSSQVTGVRKDALGGADAVGVGGVLEIARYVWRLRGFARRRGAAVLHANSLKADLIGGLAARLAGIPVVWHIHDRIADDYLPALAARAFRGACRVVPNVVVANSRATLQTLQLPATSNARVIYNGILPPNADTQIASPSAEASGAKASGAETGSPSVAVPFSGASNGHAPTFAGRAVAQSATSSGAGGAPGAASENLRAASDAGEIGGADGAHGGAQSGAQSGAGAQGQADAGASGPVIGLVGRISPWKGQDVFLRAAAQVQKRYPRAHFQIIGAPLFGEEDYETQLRALCSQLGLDGCVEWLGFRSDVPALIEKMTILAHASKIGEPFGQVVVEAMMAARPLVATRGGGIPEIVEDEKTGLLVPMDDAPALADALLRLLDAPQWAAQLGRAGERRARQHFTIGHTLVQIDRLYEDVVRQRGARRRARLAGAALAGTLLWLWLRRTRPNPRP